MAEINGILIKKGMYCLTKELNEKQEKYIKSTFTIKNKNIMGYFDIIKCYYHKKANNENCILLPRFAPLYLKKIRFKLQNNISKGKSINYNLIAKFAGNQKVIYDEIFKSYFNNENLINGMAGVIINLEAGQGKTFLSLHIIATLKLKTYIVVHNELMLNQWIKVIAEYIPGTNIGKWYAKKKEDGDIIIGIINSALEYNNWQDIGLCIFDEAHLYCSKKRSEIFKICQSSYMLGLSATPDEKKEKQDNTYKIIQWEIGPILNAATLNNYVASAVPFTGIVNMIKYHGPPEYTQTQINEILGMVSNPKMIQQLTEDKYRMKLIVNEVTDAVKTPATNLFVFANRRSYLEEIHNKLLEHINNTNICIITDEKEEINANIQISTIMGQSSNEAVEFAEQNSNIILTTYQYFGTGKSIPRMNAMILSTPFKTGSRQYINRIFRLGSDHTITRKIIDIVDWGCTLKSQWYWRKKYYNEKQYPIEVKEIKWSDIEINQL